jgi:hypothetical protein
MPITNNHSVCAGSRWRLGLTDAIKRQLAASDKHKPTHKIYHRLLHHRPSLLTRSINLFRKSRTRSTIKSDFPLADNHNHRMNRPRSESPSLLETRRFALESLRAAGFGTPTPPSTVSIAGETNPSPSCVEEDDQMAKEDLSQHRSVNKATALLCVSYQPS